MSAILKIHHSTPLAHPLSQVAMFRRREMWAADRRERREQQKREKAQAAAEVRATTAAALSPASGRLCAC